MIFLDLCLVIFIVCIALFLFYKIWISVIKIIVKVEFIKTKIREDLEI